MVMPPGASSLIGLSGAPIPIKVGDKLRQVPHVVGGAGDLVVYTKAAGDYLRHRCASYDTLPPKFAISRAGRFKGRTTSSSTIFMPA
jgi:hypothetical protein